jgi:hypothetical protein
LLVGLLHVALLGALWKLPVWADRVGTQAMQPALVVTLWQQARQAARPSKPPDTPDTPNTPDTPARRVALPPMRRPEPQAITLPAEASAPTAPVAATGSVQEGTPAPAERAAVANTAVPAASPPPLNLTLPRSASAPWRQRHAALDDPRSNTPKLTMEEKLANAMGGDGSWHAERLDGDRIRYRRGDECLLATRSRAGQLELGNGAFRNSWLVGNC